MKNQVISLLGCLILIFCTAQAQPLQLTPKSNFNSPHTTNSYLSKEFPTLQSPGNHITYSRGRAYDRLTLREPKTEKMDSASLRLFSPLTSSWITYLTAYFEYNDHQLLSFQYEAYIDPVTGKKEYEYGAEFIYNDEDLIATYYNSNYDTLSQSWTRDYRETYSYDDGLLTEETFAYLEDTGWVYTSKHVMTYSGGLLTEFKYLDWIEETSTWQELTKQNYTYTSLKKVKSILSYEKNVLTQQWKLVSREQNEYNGLLLTKSTYDYDSGFGLQPEAKKEFTYTPTGKLKKINFFFWGFAPDWTLKYKQEYEYNAIDTLSAISNWTYNDQLPDWEGVDRTEYIYTPYHALWFEIYQDWNSATSSWVNEYRTELIYDETVDGDMILWPEAQNEENVISSFDKKLLAVTDDLYDEASGQWIPFDTILPYYSLIVATHDVQVGSFSVFPNPASDEIVVDIGDHMNLLIEIFDNLGRRINQQPLNTGETHLQIDKESMPQGLYTWRVMHSSGQFMDAGKIIVLQN